MPLHCDEITGSSPRMRGTLPVSCIRITSLGIIPAHAGNTHIMVGYLAGTEDHPRACGEHFDHKGETLPAQGSSPRMRGTQVAGRLGQFHVGIIPAHAGNTGKVAVFIEPPTGIIPAHAGNTSTCRETSQETRDHPRACGEHGDYADYAIRNKGSSPRMRGTQVNSFSEFYNTGIIPAHAGNTPPSVGWWCPAWDHPRACGEHPRVLSMMCMELGSSPRMRGTRHVYRQ